MTLVRTITGFCIALLFTAFAVMNRHNIDLFWSPLHPALPVPLYLLALGMLAAGFLLGGVIVWLNMSPLRREKRHQRKIIHALEKELETTRPKILPPKPFA